METFNKNVSALCETFCIEKVIPFKEVRDDENAIKARKELEGQEKAIIVLDTIRSRGLDFKMKTNGYSIAIVDRDGDLRISDIEEFLGRAARDQDVGRGVVYYVNDVGEKINAKTVLEAR